MTCNLSDNPNQEKDCTNPTPGHTALGSKLHHGGVEQHISQHYQHTSIQIIGRPSKKVHFSKQVPIPLPRTPLSRSFKNLREPESTRNGREGDVTIISLVEKKASKSLRSACPITGRFPPSPRLASPRRVGVASAPVAAWTPSFSLLGVSRSSGSRMV
jgi:hypothetical protein